MRVGIVTPRYPPNVEGGGERSAQLLAEQLAVHAAVDAVTVFSFDGETVERRNGIEIQRLCRASSIVTEWQNLKAGYHLKDQLSEVDVLHAYNMELHPIVGLLGLGNVDATVATLNSYHFLPKSVSNTDPGPLERLYELIGHPTTGRLMLQAMSRIDAFVAISTAVRDIYAAHGVPPDRIRVVPNMLDPEFTVPDRESGAGKSLLYVGEISHRKGVGDLVRALAELPADYSLRIVGDGPAMDEVRELTESLGLTDRTMLTGHVDYDELTTEYATADVFVHPGVWPEPFGRTVLEAMQAGLPVVCTDVGGPSDIVQDEALKCPPGEPDALANAISTAVEMEGVGERNRTFANETYAPAKVTANIVALYEELLAGTTKQTVMKPKS
ncbi:glycosyltransferase family 4 protein [Halomicroarcula sp. F13]|uniref:Glycosyltransferase family 4 protein n=1 Tax=Haloarcula rubra TaxID=2487747 RepID=A0AAW4PQY1_9EURY|nr:glycosyltransferase family 4 protein [Halomicroarcula rubra]MBX0323116.1 glycosyltransferase family 4 protein [Halomicroarcula rubra]